MSLLCKYRLEYLGVILLLLSGTHPFYVYAESAHKLVKNAAQVKSTTGGGNQSHAESRQNDVDRQVTATKPYLILSQSVQKGSNAFLYM